MILLEADTLPKNNNYINVLISEIVKNKHIGYVQGNENRISSKSFIGKVLDYQFEIYHKEVLKNNEVIKWLCSGRAGRAFSKKVYKSLRWPNNVPEDSYALLWCKKNNIQTSFQAGAISLYKGPDNITDYLKETKKLISGEISLRKYFPKDLVRKLYYLPILSLIIASIKFLLKHPLSFFVYIILKITSNSSKIELFSDLLPVTTSTKKL